MELTRLQNVLPRLNSDQAKSALLSYIDIVSTSTGRATHYNTKEEQNEAALAAHKAVFELDRGVYSALTTLPGITDYSKQAAIYNLLSTPYPMNQRLSMSSSMELKLIRYLIKNMPVHRVLNLFLRLVESKRNSSRISRLMLKYILESESFDFWTVKYREKIKTILIHALGSKASGLIAFLCSKGSLTDRERKIFHDKLGKYAISQNTFQNIAFIFDHKTDGNNKYIQSFYEARNDLSKGHLLPPEVLEGIRSKYHRDIDSSKVLEITSKIATNTQKMRSQKKAKESKIELEFDPSKMDAVRLYIYSFNEGMTDEIRIELFKKARKTAEKMLYKFGKTAIIVDNSLSMIGSEDQKYRPISIALSLRDLLIAASEDTEVFYTCDKVKDRNLAEPKGDTDIASLLLDAYETQPDSVYIISDGYENNAAGRTAEIIRLAEKVGIKIPVIHLNPVAASEVIGVRSIGAAETISVNSADSFSHYALRAGILTALNRTIESFFRKTLLMLKETR